MIDLKNTRLVGDIQEPNMSYETNEFLIRTDLEGTIWAGSDSGCSCYDGFDPANYEPFHSIGDLRQRFASWIDNWGDGVGLEAAAWEEFHAALMAI
jgi:hypothetical protein